MSKPSKTDQQQQQQTYLPYSGLASNGYPTQTTLAESAVLSGLPLPGALPTSTNSSIQPQQLSSTTHNSPPFNPWAALAAMGIPYNPNYASFLPQGFNYQPNPHSNQFPFHDPNVALLPFTPPNTSNLALPTLSSPNNIHDSSGLMIRTGATPNGSSAASMAFSKNLSQFLLKLYNMVDDQSTDNLIHWTDSGNSFIVENHEELARKVLPKFFKHSNFSSFVRQLNMYSFRKVAHVTQGSLAGSTEDHRWEFCNEHFVKGLPDHLIFITRKKGHNINDYHMDNADMSSVLLEVTNVRKHQLTLSTEQKELQAHIQLLWRDILNTKDQVRRQQTTIDKILRFLASLYSAKTSESGTAHVDTSVSQTATPTNSRKRKLLEYTQSSSSAKRRPSEIDSASSDMNGFLQEAGIANIVALPDSPVVDPLKDDAPTSAPLMDFYKESSISPFVSGLDDPGLIPDLGSIEIPDSFFKDQPLLDHLQPTSTMIVSPPPKKAARWSKNDSPGTSRTNRPTPDHVPSTLLNHHDQGAESPPVWPSQSPATTPPSPEELSQNTPPTRASHEDRLNWLTSQASQIGDQVNDLMPAIDSLTELTVGDLGDLDLDALLASLPDFGEVANTSPKPDLTGSGPDTDHHVLLVPNSTTKQLASPQPQPPPAPPLYPGTNPMPAQVQQVMPPLPDPAQYASILNLLQHPATLAMLAAAQQQQQQQQNAQYISRNTSTTPLPPNYFPPNAPNTVPLNWGQLAAHFSAAAALANYSNATTASVPASQPPSSLPTDQPPAGSTMK